MTEVVLYRAIINQHQEHKQTIWDAQCVDRETLQGYLAHKDPPPPGRTPQKPYAWGPGEILGGWCFL